MTGEPVDPVVDSIMRDWHGRLMEAADGLEQLALEWSTSKDTAEALRQIGGEGAWDQERFQIPQAESVWETAVVVRGIAANIWEAFELGDGPATRSG